MAAFLSMALLLFLVSAVGTDAVRVRAVGNRNNAGARDTSPSTYSDTPETPNCTISTLPCGTGLPGVPSEKTYRYEEIYETAKDATPVPPEEQFCFKSPTLNPPSSAQDSDFNAEGACSAAYNFANGKSCGMSRWLSLILENGGDNWGVQQSEVCAQQTQQEEKLAEFHPTLTQQGINEVTHYNESSEESPCGPSCMTVMPDVLKNLLEAYKSEIKPILLVSIQATGMLNSATQVALQFAIDTAYDKVFYQTSNPPSPPDVDLWGPSWTDQFMAVFGSAVWSFAIAASSSFTFIPETFPVRYWEMGSWKSKDDFDNALAMDINILHNLITPTIDISVDNPEDPQNWKSNPNDSVFTDQGIITAAKDKMKENFYQNNVILVNAVRSGLSSIAQSPDARAMFPHWDEIEILNNAQNSEMLAQSFCASTDAGQRESFLVNLWAYAIEYQTYRTLMPIRYRVCSEYQPVCSKAAYGLVTLACPNSAMLMADLYPVNTADVCWSSKISNTLFTTDSSLAEVDNNGASSRAAGTLAKSDATERLRKDVKRRIGARSLIAKRTSRLQSELRWAECNNKNNDAIMSPKNSCAENCGAKFKQPDYTKCFDQDSDVMKPFGGLEGSDCCWQKYNVGKKKSDVACDLMTDYTDTDFASTDSWNSWLCAYTDNTDLDKNFIPDASITTEINSMMAFFDLPNGRPEEEEARLVSWTPGGRRCDPYTPVSGSGEHAAAACPSAGLSSGCYTIAEANCLCDVYKSSTCYTTDCAAASVPYDQAKCKCFECSELNSLTSALKPSVVAKRANPGADLPAVTENSVNFNFGIWRLPTMEVLQGESARKVVAAQYHTQWNGTYSGVFARDCCCGNMNSCSQNEPAVDWRKCSDEGGTCTCTSTVRFGTPSAQGRWVYSKGSAAAPSVACNKGSFKDVDPAVGTVKECQCDYPVTKAPTPSPTRRPTTMSPSAPSASPSASPSSAPTTAHPSSSPSAPTASPTASPSSAPTLHPSSSPTNPTTWAPTQEPTMPTSAPTATPSKPTPSPTTLSPTSSPTTAEPTTSVPTQAPTCPAGWTNGTRGDGWVDGVQPCPSSHCYSPAKGVCCLPDSECVQYFTTVRSVYVAPWGSSCPESQVIWNASLCEYAATMQIRGMVYTWGGLVSSKSRPVGCFVTNQQKPITAYNTYYARYNQAKNDAWIQSAGLCAATAAASSMSESEVEKTE